MSGLKRLTAHWRPSEIYTVAAGHRTTARVGHTWPVACSEKLDRPSHMQIEA